MSEELTDVELVDLLRTDRSAGFDRLYRRYAPRLFAYAVTVLRDRAAAEDATHDSLMAAVAKIDNLRAPAQLRSWLFAITRNRCLTMLADTNRFTDAEDGFDMIPGTDDPTVGLAQADAAALVAEALAGLAPADRDTLALALRNDLDMAELALAMGSNQPTARARISRAKASLTGSVTGLLLARDATRDQAAACPGLTQALAGFSGEWTPLIRKRVAKHVKSCEQCNERGHQRAVSYVSAFTLPVVLVLAPQFRARADEGLTTLDDSGAGDWLDLRSDGFPRTSGGNGGRFGRRLLVAGIAGVALLLTALVTWQVSADPAPEVSPVVAPATASATPSLSDTPTPTPTPTTTARAKKASPKPDGTHSAPTARASDPVPTDADTDAPDPPRQSKRPAAESSPPESSPEESSPEVSSKPDPSQPPQDEPEPTKDPVEDPPPAEDPQPADPKTPDTPPRSDPPPQAPPKDDTAGSGTGAVAPADQVG